MKQEMNEENKKWIKDRIDYIEQPLTGYGFHFFRSPDVEDKILQMQWCIDHLGERLQEYMWSYKNQKKIIQDLQMRLKDENNSNS